MDSRDGFARVETDPKNAAARMAKAYPFLLDSRFNK
jgi:hypothetical protein